MRLAILEPASLTGKEVKEALERRRDLWTDARLLTAADDDEALVSEIAGEAALVHALNAENLEGVDLLFACGEPHDDTEALLRAVAAVDRVILVSPDHLPPELPAIVAGVNLERLEVDRLPIRVVSPHAGAVALAHLLHPLGSLELSEAAAWIVQPASAHGQAGIDELLDQTRGILAFSNDLPNQVFGGRLALNLMPAQGDGGILDAVRQALGEGPRLAATLVQGPIFHSVALSVLVRFAGTPAADQVRAALEASPHIELQEGHGSVAPLGPIDASGSDRLLIGRVEPHREDPASFWLWAAMDNLTLGAAGNAVAIAEVLLGIRN